MDVSLLGTLDEAYQQRLLEVDGAVLADVHGALVRAKVCVKRGAPAVAREGLRDLFTAMTSEEDASKIERKLLAIGRVISSWTERAWFERGEPTRIAILWLVTCMTVARLSQLDAMSKSSSTLVAAAGGILKSLAEMTHVPESDEADCLHLRGLTKSLVVCIVGSVPIRDKSNALMIFESLRLRAEDVLVPLAISSSGGKVNCSAVEFSRAWITNAQLPDALQTVTFVLQKCVTTPVWRRIYNDLVTERPVLAALLVEDVDVACEHKIGDANFRRFVLDNIITGLIAVSTVASTVVDRLLCIALHDQDVVLRALAWKTLTGTSGKMSQGDRCRLMTLACDAFFVERSRSVGAAILKLFLAEHRRYLSVASNVNTDATIARRVQEFLLCLMSQRGVQFPSSWTQDAIHLLTEDRLGMPSDLVLKSFSTGTMEGQKLIARTYREYLVSLGVTDARRELECLARCVDFDTVAVFDSLIESVCNDVPTDQQRNSRCDTSSRACYNPPITLFDESVVSSRQHLCASILLESATLRAFTDSTPRLEALYQASSQMLLTASSMLVKAHGDHRYELEAFAAVRGFRVVLSLDSDAERGYIAAVESALQLHLATLVTYPALQRETVQLLYLLTRPQEKAYWCLASSQEDAFTDIAKLTSFIALVGVVASENALYLTQQQHMRKTEEQSHESDDDEEQRTKGTDYMEQFKDSLALKNRIRDAKEASISDGLLAAYLPLIERALDKSQATKVKIAAMWTLGEFMKISPLVTEVYFAKLLNIIRAEGVEADVAMACIDVWHTLQPTMKPSRTKEEGVEAVYQLVVKAEKDGAVVTHALKSLQHLVLHSQLRDDRLHLFSICLLAPNTNAQEITQRFFLSYFLQHPPAKASSTIFEVYFALVGNSRTKAVAKEVAACLIEIANDGSNSLASLESALVDELDSATRYLDALRLLGLLNVLQASTVQKVIGSIDKFLLCPNDGHREHLEQMFAKQLQRTKDKSEKAMLKDAILKVKGQRISEDASARHRRVPLNLASIGHLVQNLRE